MTINVASVTGATQGIYARRLGAGPLQITTSPTSTVMANGGLGIIASSATSLAISTGNVSATGGGGILAVNTGVGATSVSASGVIAGGMGTGVFVQNAAIATQDVTANVAQVTGTQGGITAYNNGSGSLSVSASGQVTGTANTYDGIRARNAAKGVNLTVLTTNGAGVSGANYGVSAYNRGTGFTSVTVAGPAACRAA